MAKPKYSPNETVEIAGYIKTNGLTEIDFDHIKGFLASSDQTIERFKNLIVPQLFKLGIKVSIKGNMIKVESNSQNGNEPMKAESESNETRLTHQYVAPTNYLDCLTAILMGDNALFHGPPGCGKSLTAERIGHELGTEVFKRKDYKVGRLSLGGYFNPADLTGEMLLMDSPTGNGVVTQYIYGHLTEAVEKGYMLICDEVDCMSPEANSAFQRITETDGRVIIKTERGPVEIKKHPHYRLVFTSNTVLTGDPTGMFSGAQVQNSAFKDRINSIFEFDYMPMVERGILAKNYKLPTKVCEVLYGPNGTDPTKGIVNLIRAACKAGTIQAHLSMRTIVEVAKHYRAFNGKDVNKCHSWHKSMYYCFISKFPPQYQNTILGMIRQAVGEELVPTIDKREIEKHTDYLKRNGFFPTEDTYMPEELKALYV
jgi:hypothetical protein